LDEIDTTNLNPRKQLSENLLEVRNLVTGFDTDTGPVRAVDGVSFIVPKGRTVGIVGESGCGKSVTALSIMRLLPQPMGRILEGQVLLEGKDILRIEDEEMRRIRGARIGMIFQEPMSALNPVHRIGKQLIEVYLEHLDISREEAMNRAIELLGHIGIPSPEVRVTEYPHQLSGGMRQRVVIAMALACKPSLIIADEPTTALDVTIQAQILDLLKALQREMDTSTILITHDLGVIAETCDEVVVMYAGRVAECGPVRAIFEHPGHPYTKGLLNSIPRLDHPRKTHLSIIEGMVPGLLELPPGCRFQNRCPYRREQCGKAPPPMEEISHGHSVACFRREEIQ